MLLTRSLRRFPFKIVLKCLVIKCFFIIVILNSDKNSKENEEAKSDPPNRKNIFIETEKRKSESTDLKNVLRNRLKHLQSSCSSISSDGQSLTSVTKLQSKQLFWCKKTKIVYCPVFKSASSAWLEHLINLSGRSQSSIIDAKKKKKRDLLGQLVYLGIVKPSDAEWQDYLTLENTRNLTAFTVVRHPFERLVSAYRDKLERKNRYYYDLFGKVIVSKFREKAIKRLGKEFFEKSNNFGTVLKVADGSRVDAKFPSFWEFVQCVVTKMCSDEHWNPIYQHCSICHPLQLSTNPYILKFEHLKDEGPEFLQMMGWDKKIQDNAKVNANTYSGMSGAEITKLYFSTFSESEIMEVYKHYEYDFILFDYNFQIGDISLP